MTLKIVPLEKYINKVNEESIENIISAIRENPKFIISFSNTESTYIHHSFNISDLEMLWIVENIKKQLLDGNFK